MSANERQMLRVVGPHDFAALRVLDGTFEVVATGLGSIATELPLGAYAVESEHPGRHERRLITLEPGSPAIVQGFDPKLSPPLLALEDPLVADAARVGSRRLSTGRRGFGRVIIYVAGAPEANLDLRVVDERREVVVGGTNTDWLRHGSLNIAAVDVFAGTYAIEHEVRPFGGRTAPIRVERGFETQVFFDHNDRADPLRAIHTRRVGVGYDPSDLVGYARVEAIVIGIESGRAVLPKGMVRAVLDGEIDDPMLVMLTVYAAWCFGRLNQADLSRAASAVAAVMPSSADAGLLEIALQGGTASSRTVATPPMLALATDRLLAIAAGRPIVEPGSWIAVVSPHLTSTGVWTRWVTDRASLGARIATRLQVEDIARALPGESLEHVARVAGLPQSAVTPLAAAVRNARRGPIWRAAGDLVMRMRDVLLDLREDIAGGARREPDTPQVGGLRTIDEAALSTAPLPAAQQWYLDARLLPAARRARREARRWRLLGVAAALSAGAAAIAPILAGLIGVNLGSGVLVAVGGLILVVVVAAANAAPFHRWRVHAETFEQLSQSVRRFVRDPTFGTAASDQAFEAMVSDVETIVARDPRPIGRPGTVQAGQEAKESHGRPDAGSSQSLPPAAFTAGWLVAELRWLVEHGRGEEIVSSQLSDADSPPPQTEMEMLVRELGETLDRLGDEDERLVGMLADVTDVDSAGTSPSHRLTTLHNVHVRMLTALAAREVLLRRAYEMGTLLAETSMVAADGAGSTAKLASDRFDALTDLLEGLTQCLSAAHGA